MAAEIGQWTEWNSNSKLDWNILDYPSHCGIQLLVRDLNKLYCATQAFWEDDFTPAGFQWIDGGDYQQSVISFIRWDKARKNPVVIIINLTPVVRDNYNMGVPFEGEWTEIFNSDAQRYGGTNLLNKGHIHASHGTYHGQPYHINIRIPWLGAAMFMKKK
jgi:1,4-alpha-glucan branching enzyme